jgi:ubiquinone/menaquinone biosynthesis C-methylase UbiE
MVTTNDPGLASGMGPATLEPSAIALLQCPHCGKRLTVSAGTIVCPACHSPVPVRDGIIDFVAGRSATVLDNIDYDQFYAVSLESSRELLGTIKTSAGPYWPQTLGNAVEIGCGTGGFSMTILSHLPATQVVLTDVSTKMLGLCRARLNQLGTVRTDAVTFATYSGTENCFAPDAFDTCYGTSVVHHLIDVPGFLGHVHRLLRPGGRAFFMEPNLRFHQALTATLADILAEWIRQATVPDSEISLMLNWMAEVHCNVVNSGEVEILAEREDKHQFVAETFEAMADAAGFASALSIPCGLDRTGLTTISVYIGQCGVSSRTLELLRQIWPAAQQRYFSALELRDLSPSYLFWLTKGLWQVPRSHGSAEPPRQAATASASAAWSPLHLWLDVAVRQDGDGLAVVAQGWCVAVERVKSVEITVGEHRRRLPIWRPRPDVQMRMNASGTFPPLHALCSGVEGSVRLPAQQAADSPIAVTIDIVTTDDRILSGGIVALLPNGASELVNRAIG